MNIYLLNTYTITSVMDKNQAWESRSPSWRHNSYQYFVESKCIHHSLWTTYIDGLNFGYMDSSNTVVKEWERLYKGKKWWKNENQRWSYKKPKSAWRNHWILQNTLRRLLGIFPRHFCFQYLGSNLFNDRRTINTGPCTPCIELLLCSTYYTTLLSWTINSKYRTTNGLSSAPDCRPALRLDWNTWKLPLLRSYLRVPPL